MAEPVKIAIVMEGGCVQCVLTAGVPVEYALVDYDTEGAGADVLRNVPQDGGGTYPAVVTSATTDSAGPFVLQAFALADDQAGRCSRCGADLANPSAAGAEDGICGECIDGDCRTCAEATETRAYACDECGALDEDE